MTENNVEQTQPNILFIMTDQQRYDSLGCYGFEPAHTPNLDRLAEQGVIFEHCTVNNPLCTPSRASVMTGKHLPGHGVYKLYDNLPETEVLFPEHLQRLGYKTALVGKLHVSSVHHESLQRHPHDGFDEYQWCHEGFMKWDSPFHAYRAWLEEVNPEFAEELNRQGRNLKHHPEDLHFTHWAAERTIDFIQRQDGSQPFFCMMSLFDPHNPYDDYPLSLSHLVNESDLPDAQFTDIDVENLPAGLRQQMDPRALRDASHEELRAMRFGYHVSIAFADREIGRVLDTLDEQGIADNTLVIFVSDHGDMLGDHRLFVKGAYCFDANVRVPLLMRWPAQFDGGHSCKGLVQNHDLAATIIDAAGMSLEEQLQWMPDARSLLDMARGDVEAIRDHAVCLYRNSGRGNAIYWDPPLHCTLFRDERYKLHVFHTTDNTDNLPEGELYDMLEDPNEIHNHWDDPEYTQIKSNLLLRLNDWLAQQEQSGLGSRGGEALPG